MERNSLVNWQERKTGNWEKQNFGLVTWSKKSEIADEILEGATKRALTSYRVAWEDAIDYISGETKEKIIKAAKNIPLYMNIDSEGNVWVRFILGNKQWAYMYPELINHTDDKYKHINQLNITGRVIVDVNDSSIRQNDIKQWKNKKLKNYVQEMQKKWINIISEEEKSEILSELWKLAKLEKERDQILMLMYLTGMEWEYWIQNWISMDCNGRQGGMWYTGGPSRRLWMIVHKKENNDKEVKDDSTEE